MDIVLAMILAYIVSGVIALAYFNVSLWVTRSGELYLDGDIVAGKKTVSRKLLEKQPEFILKAIFWPIFVLREMAINIVEKACSGNAKGAIAGFIAILLIIGVFLAFRYIKGVKIET